MKKLLCLLSLVIAAPVTSHSQDLGYTNAVRALSAVRNVSPGGAFFPIINGTTTLPNAGGTGSLYGFWGTNNAATTAVDAQIGWWTLEMQNGLNVTSDDTGSSIEFYNAPGGGGRAALLRWTATSDAVVTQAAWVTEVEALGTGGSFWRYTSTLGGDSVDSGLRQYPSTGQWNHFNTPITGYNAFEVEPVTTGEYHQIYLSIAPGARINFNLDTRIQALPVPEPGVPATLGALAVLGLMRRKRS